MKYIHEIWKLLIPTQTSYILCWSVWVIYTQYCLSKDQFLRKINNLSALDALTSQGDPKGPFSSHAYMYMCIHLVLYPWHWNWFGKCQTNILVKQFSLIYLCLHVVLCGLWSFILFLYPEAASLGRLK